MIHATIDLMDPSELILQFNADFIAGAAEDVEGTGGNTAVPTDWSDGGQTAPDSILVIPENIGVWTPGATGIITIVNDCDFSPAVLTLPLSFRVGM